jgi:hypothetical protein
LFEVRLLPVVVVVPYFESLMALVGPFSFFFYFAFFWFSAFMVSQLALGIILL